MEIDEILQQIFFFFSSRRRHTRYWRDWSSDVCSSDLRVPELRRAVLLRHGPRGGAPEHAGPHEPAGRSAPGLRHDVRAVAGGDRPLRRPEIGRASCWGRVWISVVALSVKKKKQNIDAV